MDWLDKFEKARLTQTKDFTIDIIPTSYLQLDEILGVGGIPREKIVEIAGESGAGKTALVLDIVASAQENNLNVVYLDLDRKFDKEFATIRKVKCDDLLIFRPDANNPKNISLALRELISKHLVDVVVFDSISQLGEGIPFILQEIARDIIGTKVTVILTSQIRQGEHYNDYKTPYMASLNQYCNIRMMLEKTVSIKHQDILIGKKVSVDIYKNAMSEPKTTEIEIYF